MSIIFRWMVENVKCSEGERHVRFDRSVYQALTMVGQFGISMLVPVLACSFLGAVLDRKLGTNFLVIVLFFVGALAGARNVYHFAKRVFTGETKQSAYLHKSRKHRSGEHESKNNRD